MLTMQQSWESQGILEISKGTGALLLDDHNGREFGQERAEFGNALSPQRPISAPPVSDDISSNLFQLGLGSNSKSSAKDIIESDTWGKSSLFSSSNVGSMDDSMQDRKGFSSSIQYNGNGLGGGGLSGLRSNNELLGAAINRSKSAAPQFSDIRIPFRSPPGLDSGQPNDNIGSSFHTHRSSTPGDLLGDVSNHSHTPSLAESTGYEKPVQKTVMDLIQEDFPKTPSPEYENDPISDLPGSSRSSLSDKLLVSDPVNSYAKPSRNDGNEIPSYHRTGLQNGMKNNIVSNESTHTNYSSQHHYAQNLNSNMDNTSTMSSRMPTVPTGTHPSQQLHQGMRNPNSYTPQQMHYNYHGEGGAVPAPAMQTQVMPTGHNVAPNVSPTMYVNHLPYGQYATVQYAPAPYPHPGVPNHVVHPNGVNMGGRAPHGHEYVSVMPIQAGIPAHMIGSNGAYIYYPTTPSSAAVHPTLTVVDSNGRPSEAVAVHSIPVGSLPSSSGRGNVARGKIPSNRPNSPNSKSNRSRYGRPGSKKSGGSQSLDSSRHSLSSFCTNILEDFRTSKSCSWTAFDVKGNIVELCQDQYGSRFIQQRLETENEEEKSMILNEVLPSVRRLRNDVFGNYVVQKLLENGTSEMKDELKNTLQGEVLSLSTQMYGCRVVQKALECLNDEDLPSILAEFHGQVLTCIHDQNGNHVIQKCIEVMSAKAKIAKSKGQDEKCEEFMKEIEFILKCVWEAVAPLSCHPYGCRVLQRILEHCVESQKTTTLDYIKRCHRVLLDDQYGNYVIQHVLQFGRNTDRDSILDIVVESGILALSRQKFASNVVEKLLKYGTPGQRNAVVREMLKVAGGKGAGEDSKGSSVVLFMVKDQYANYVVQTCLDVVPEGKEKRNLLQELNNNASQLKNYTFAKHIITKLGGSTSD